MNTPTTEKFDPALRDRSKAEFKALIERLEISGNLPVPRDRLWQWASSEHPQGKQWYFTWKDQDRLEQHEALARKQEALGITGTFGNEAGEYFANAMDAVPVKNPRSLALVGLPADASQQDFELAWIDFEKNGARKGFEREVERHQAAGHSYQKSWELAGMNEPGKTHFRNWKAAADLQKRSR
jgi:YD repeat-containing protein